MFIKFLSIIVLVHTTRSQFNFGGLGGLDFPTGAVRGVNGGLLGGVLPQGQFSLADNGLGVNLVFGDFTTTFKKTYASPAEENRRRQIYLANQKFVSAHNALYEQGIEKYSLAINYFGDWTHSEYLEILGMDLSEVSSNDVDNRRSRTNKRQTRALDKCQSPDEKDWRKDGAVTPVKNQEKCASCWAFSAAGALEGHFFLKNGKLNPLSEQQFVDCSKQLGNNGCHKGTMNKAFQYAKDDGIVTDDEYPYEAKDNICRASPNSMKIEGIESIPKGDEEKLKDAVCRIGPISAALDARDKKFMFYHDGVYFNSDCNPKNTTHAVLVIGYGFDESTELDYWLIKNSYGETWGKTGYGKVARNEKNHCGIANVASYPLV